MTDRAKALVVYLDDDYRIGDGDSGADRLIAAIEVMRGVAGVEPLGTTGTDHMARERVRADLHGHLINAIDEVFRGRA